MSIAEIGERTRALRAQVAHAFIGQAEVFDQVLLALLAAGHVLIEGVPGLGKTLLVRALAASVGCTFGRIQFTPDLMPADVTGHAIYDPKSERFQIRRGPVFANLLLADEINRAPAKTQAALLESMQEGQVTIEGRRFALPAPFMVVATQNPIEQEGTYPLPEAQLDRFLIKVVIGYPDAGGRERAWSPTWSAARSPPTSMCRRVRPVMGQAELLAMQQGVAAIRMDAAVTDYAVRIVRTTREWPGVIGGAGPRGGLALARLARAQRRARRARFRHPRRRARGGPAGAAPSPAAGAGGADRTPAPRRRAGRAAAQGAGTAPMMRPAPYLLWLLLGWTRAGRAGQSGVAAVVDLAGWPAAASRCWPLFDGWRLRRMPSPQVATGGGAGHAAGAGGARRPAPASAHGDGRKTLRLHDMHPGGWPVRGMPRDGDALPGSDDLRSTTR